MLILVNADAGYALSGYIRMQTTILLVSPLPELIW